MSLQNLANETLHSILILVDKADLVSLCLTSWQINSAATDVLYRCHANVTDSADISTLLLRTICESSDLAAKIKVVTFKSFGNGRKILREPNSMDENETRGTDHGQHACHKHYQLFLATATSAGLLPQRDWDDSTATSAVDLDPHEQLVHALKLGSKEAHNLLILGLLPNINSVNILESIESYPSTLEWTQLLSGSATALRGISRIKISKKVNRFVPDNITATLPSILPHLRILLLKNVHLLAYDPPLSSLSTTVLTYLVLRRCTFDISWLQQVLHCQPLETFGYWPHLARPPPAHLVMGALHQCNNSLRTLTLRPPHHPSHSPNLDERMQEFRALDHLSVLFINLISSANDSDIDSLLQARVPKHTKTLSLWIRRTDHELAALYRLANLCENGTFPDLTEIRNITMNSPYDPYDKETFASHRAAFAEAGISFLDLHVHKEGSKFAGLEGTYVVASEMSQASYLGLFPLVDNPYHMTLPIPPFHPNVTSRPQ